MFRKMLRIKQQLSNEECKMVLAQSLRGVLSVIGDEGYPYGIPLNHWYSEKEGKIYFHCGKEGHKIDSIRACPKASFCTWDDGVVPEGQWYKRFRSVVVFGKIELVQDEEKIREICKEITNKFPTEPDYFEKESKSALSRTLCLSLTIEHMTGKIVNEA